MQQEHTTDYSDTTHSGHKNGSNLATAILHTTQAVIDMKAHLCARTETSPSTAAVSALSITLPAVQTPASNSNGNKIRGDNCNPTPSPLTQVATFSSLLCMAVYSMVYPGIPTTGLYPPDPWVVVLQTCQKPIPRAVGMGFHG
jgi:hypothetical protein